MRDFLKKHGNLVRLAALLAFFVICATDSYFTMVGINAAVNAIAVIGIVLISGFTRQIHLGQAAFIGIGAYTSAILMTKLGMNFWLTIPCAVLVSALIGAVLGVPTLKLRDGPYLALVTQIFGEIIYVFALNLEGLTGGSFGMSKLPAPKIGSLAFSSRSSKLLFLVVIFLLLSYFVADRITKSKYGRFFLSIRESETAAQSVGVNTMKYKIIAFTLSSAFAGLAGVFYAQSIGFISPDQFRWQTSLTLLSMAIIGGVGSLQGGILGAVLLTLLPEALRLLIKFLPASMATNEAQLRLIINSVLVILSLTFLPDGIISLFGKSRAEIKLMMHERMKMFSDKNSGRRKKKKRKLA